MTCTVYIGTSIDGYIAGPEHDISWLETVPNPEGSDLGFFDFIAEIDALVMGRVTFETVIGFGMGWHYPVPGIILSNTMTQIPADLDQSKLSLFSGTPAATIEHARSLGYERLYIDGGDTVQQFLAADLIDDLIISELPVLVGGGTLLFGTLAEQQVYELIHSEVLLEQIVKRHYRRKR